MTGRRVAFGGDLRGRMRELHRRVSRFAQQAPERFGVEVVCRGTEFTVDEALSFHVHANVLYAPRAALPRHRWEAFLRWMHASFKALVHDAGRLGGPALARVYRETRGLKVAQPLGAFRDFWRRLERERLKALLVAGGRPRRARAGHEAQAGRSCRVPHFPAQYRRPA